MPRRLAWNIPFTLTVPGYEPLTSATPPLQIGARLNDVFIALATTPKTWPGETGAPAGPVPAAAAWTFNGFEALGTAARTRDVRLVVLAEMFANDKTRRCTGYIGAKDFTATSYDVELKIVDRVTKEALVTRRFAGNAACPREVVVGPGMPAAYSGGPDGLGYDRWVRSQLAPLAKKLGG